MPRAQLSPLARRGWGIFASIAPPPSLSFSDERRSLSLWPSLAVSRFPSWSDRLRKKEPRLVALAIESLGFYD
jgi:hypothetical protein